MDGYTKLHAKIVHSSIWNEPDHVRLLWVTLLAIADADGNVEGSVGGLAHLARITPTQAKDAIARLTSPDPDSCDETDGVRINQIAAGVYHIINHSKYRDRQTRRQAINAAASKKYRDKKAKADSDTNTYTGRDDVSPRQVTSDDGADASSEFTYPEDFEAFWAGYPKKRQKGAALKAWKKLGAADRKKATEQAGVYAKAIIPGRGFILNPATWLNGRSFDDVQEDHAACDRSTLSPQQLCDLPSNEPSGMS